MEEILQQRKRRAKGNGVFFLYTLFTFVIFSSFLFAIDFVPEKQVTEANVDIRVTETQNNATTTSNQQDLASDTQYSPETTKETANEGSLVPIEIVIDSIGVDTPIIAPDNSSIEVLDRALLLGAVHYPGSAQLGEAGNVLIFGHSSHLPVVRNKAYKAFNEIDELKPGEEIIIRSLSHEYVYEVQHVALQKAQEARIYFEADQPMLTLVTCDNFGSEEDRWVVQAVQIEKIRL